MKIRQANKIIKKNEGILYLMLFFGDVLTWEEKRRKDRIERAIRRLGGGGRWGALVKEIEEFREECEEERQKLQEELRKEQLKEAHEYPNL